MKTPPNLNPGPRSMATLAFSLIEVVLALGIVSVALVTLLGLVPVGLNTMRDSMDATIKAQITQQMQSRVMTAAFGLPSGGSTTITTLATIASNTYYFDKDGFEQVSGSVPTPPNSATHFVVTFTHHSTTYPGCPSTSNGTTTTSPSITTMVMQIAFYGRGTNGASTVAINVPNQSGMSVTPSF